MHSHLRRVVPSMALALTALAPLVWAPRARAQKKGPATSEASTGANASAPATESAADTTPTTLPTTMAPATTATAHEEASPSAAGTSTDVEEKPGQTYIYLGLRYRGNIIPQFMVNLFVDEGATFYSNTIGIEADIRKDHFSLIPAISYTEYGTGGGVLFLEKGKDASFPGNYSSVDSSMKGLYVTADLLWSTRIHKNVDFEYGAGFGLGVLFGDLGNNWVTSNMLPGRPSYTTSKGQKLYQCGSVNDGPGCSPADHQNATTAKVNGYTESSWVNGGSKPNVFPWISLPQLGVRFKPIKQMQARAMVGFALTGFWFGLSADYGLEKPEKTK